MIAGAIALLIAFGVVVMLQVKKKRARQARERLDNQPFDDSRSAVGRGKNSRVTTQISANNTMRNSIQDNPFLTESEKAIVARAVTPDDGRDVSIANIHLHEPYANILLDSLAQILLHLISTTTSKPSSRSRDA